MPTDFQNWVALIANIGTIIALIIAFVTWITWKKQQNYSFERDKVFEAEIVINKLKNEFLNYFELKTNILSFEHDPTIQDPVNNRKLLLEVESKINCFLTDYTDSVSALEIIGIDLDKEMFKSQIELSGIFGRHLRGLSEANNSIDTLLGANELITQTIKNDMSQMITALSNKRKSL